MIKKINFGKIAANGKQKINDVVVEVEYNTSIKPKFAAMATVWNRNHTDCIMGGQCLDELKKHLGGNKLFMTIYGLWKRNHLNDVDACANDAQREAVKEYMEKHDGKYDYDGVCKFMQENGIYTVMVNNVPCTYGMEWYYRPISQEDQKIIKEIMKAT